MSFDKSHWTKPRHSIAGMPYDDLGYATHGALEAMKVLKTLDLKPSEVAGMSLLDYGCGTARVARPLSGLFARVVGYDPVPECLAEAEKERRGAKYENLTLTGTLDGLEKSFDVICSVSVMEHLVPDDQEEMMVSLGRVGKPGCMVALWYSMINNRRAVAKRFGDWFLNEDDAFMAKNPGSTIRPRLFRL